MTSFPPISEPLAALSHTDWLNVRRKCLTSIQTVITVAIWTAAVIHVIAHRLTQPTATPRVWARISPVLARVFRFISDRIDPQTAPLFAPITSADIDAMERDQLLQTIKQQVRPTGVGVPKRERKTVPTPERWTHVGDVLYKDLKAKSRDELMKLAGVTSRCYTKEQLIGRIQHGAAQ